MSFSFHLIALGKNKDAALQSLIDDYLRRIQGKVTITEIIPPQCDDETRKAKEAALIRTALPEKAVLVVLDERGDNLDSVAFARKLEQLAVHHAAPIAFVIGGADGLDEGLRRDAHWRVSFGKLTWPHMLVRLLLVEQLYRAQTILSNHPYHRV